MGAGFELPNRKSRYLLYNHQVVKPYYCIQSENSNPKLVCFPIRPTLGTSHQMIYMFKGRHAARFIWKSLYLKSKPCARWSSGLKPATA